jgi:DNA-binding response OmpR family regulator/putative methionine-R-sulfoxide reductase with GAF domain
MTEHARTLTPAEARTLAALRARPGHTFSRDELAQAAQLEPRAELSRCIDATVARLRRKLGPDGAALRTSFGDGYRWGAPANDTPPPSESRRQRLGALELDLEREFLVRDGETIPLTTLEARALQRLLEAGGAPVDPNDLGPRGSAARLVLQLRRKLGTPDLIASVRGVGYHLTTVPQRDDRFRRLAQEAAATVGTTMGLPDVVVYQRDGAVLEQRAAWGPKRSDDGAVVEPLRLPVGTGIVGWVAQHGVSALVPETRADSRYVADLVEARAELAVPVVVRGTVVGVLDCEAFEPHAFTDAHRVGLEAVARLLAASC